MGAGGRAGGGGSAGSSRTSGNRGMIDFAGGGATQGYSATTRQVVELAEEVNMTTETEKKGIKETVLLKTTTTMTDQKLLFPSKNTEVTATLVEFEKGAGLGWHQHAYVRYVYVLEGTLEIVREDGTKREFPAGTFFVESIRERHQNQGKVASKALFIDHSEEGQSNMIRG
jgi:quercetin dioxygenase-like cupin family protein